MTTNAEYFAEILGGLSNESPVCEYKQEDVFSPRLVNPRDSPEIRVGETHLVLTHTTLFKKQCKHFVSFHLLRPVKSPLLDGDYTEDEADSFTREIDGTLVYVSWVDFNGNVWHPGDNDQPVLWVELSRVPQGLLNLLGLEDTDKW